ncbi:hypothetical protein C7S18_19120 [Ahniella affigens]|uniref:TraG N-terminal Proteobacteria domain-containing protein n=1 Tax=Ahniella affigens TaxID=2021234 RepID=A0A2P1PWD7_9GAMM|nr:conjugal transfer protein TraG N-terminal domain-containing protein [Ahniella affigens]AVP99149.1 hypothetical protein C7S18_19120 [Ahniella affigens]
MFGLQVDGDSMWTIYSIGAPSFMHKVFTAVALLGEGGVLMRMGQIGFLVGLFVLIYKIATAAGSLGDLKQSLLAGVIFAAMFGTSTSVKIVGMVPGPAGYANVYVVDHVPWGIAAMGGIISGTGVYLTRRMETAFRDADAIPVTQGGFGRTAEILASVRDMAAESIPNTLPAYSYYRMSMIHYLRDCAVRARHFEVLGDHSIVHAPDPLSAIRFENGMYRTQTWLRTLTGASEQISCPDAHDLLRSKRQDMLASMDPAYQQRFGHDARDALQRAFASLASQDAEAAQKYVSGAMINALWMEAASGSTFGSHGNNTVVMIRSALEQQRVQWSTEESIFVRTMRPMIGYFEAFFYALSPFIAFLIGLGAMGLRMIVKYVSLTLAVSLWMPILAITNLYQMTTLQDFFLLQERIAVQSGSGPFSLSNSLALVDQATGAVALASMIAAATPMLTLTLLFGGAVAATSLFSRLQGQDHINEKIAMPDPTSVGAVYQANAAFTGNDAYGARQTGQEANAIKFDVGNQLQQTAMSLRSKSEQSAQEANDIWSRNLARSTALQQQFISAFDRQLNESIAFNSNEGVQWLKQHGWSNDRIAAAAKENADQSTYGAEANLSGQASVSRVAGLLASGLSLLSRTAGQKAQTVIDSVAKVADVSLSGGVGYSASETQTEKTSSQVAHRDTHGRTEAEERAVLLVRQHAAASAIRDTAQNAASLGVTSQDTWQLSNSLKKVEQSGTAYQQAANNSATFGVGQSISALAASRNLAADPARAAEAEQLARALGSDSAFETNLSAIRRGGMLGMPEDESQQSAMASLFTLAGIGPGAAITSNIEGLSGLGSDRLEALSYVVGLTRGVAQPALRAEAHEFSGLRVIDANTAEANVVDMKRDFDPGDRAGLLLGVEKQKAKSEDAQAAFERDSAATEEQYERNKSALRQVANASDAVAGGQSLITVADQFAEYNTDAVHRSVGPLAAYAVTPAATTNDVKYVVDQAAALISDHGMLPDHSSPRGVIPSLSGSTAVEHAPSSGPDTQRPVSFLEIVLEGAPSSADDVRADAVSRTHQSNTEH